MSAIVIWGAGGQAREVSWLCEELEIPVAGFLDERPGMKGRIVDGIPVLGVLADIEGLKREVELVCAGVGDPALKRQFARQTARSGFRVAGPLVHPSVHLPRRSGVGAGSVVFEGAVLSGNVRIGEHVIINRQAGVSHDTVVGDFATVSPGVHLAGNVMVGEGACIGIGASVREKCRIGRWAVVGGGAFVRGDIPDFTMAAGVPAVVKKRLQPPEEEDL